MCASRRPDLAPITPRARPRPQRTRYRLFLHSLLHRAEARLQQQAGGSGGGQAQGGASLETEFRRVRRHFMRTEAFGLARAHGDQTALVKLEVEVFFTLSSVDWTGLADELASRFPEARALLNRLDVEDRADPIAVVQLLGQWRERGRASGGGAGAAVAAVAANAAAAALGVGGDGGGGGDAAEGESLLLQPDDESGRFYQLVCPLLPAAKVLAMQRHLSHDELRLYDNHRRESNGLQPGAYVQEGARRTMLVRLAALLEVDLAWLLRGGGTSFTPNDSSSTVRRFNAYICHKREARRPHCLTVDAEYTLCAPSAPPCNHAPCASPVHI